ncbi:hypothetical protein ma396 [Moumouvirus australiensis]|uniref:Uncharacterized protein n=1 Tax=Moumouvirus australiensis TaxID=2109587 RepID=A0A2P1ELM7_9VIRU|nr:hypothetical protein QKC55_gp509 [Moumouvirus australiensis]AVL94782.1 hypothetical protein ma396 [Moumouvirus australiensis]
MSNNLDNQKNILEIINEANRVEEFFFKDSFSGSMYFDLIACQNNSTNNILNMITHQDYSINNSADKN